MTNLYLYADEKSRNVICDSTQKIITIGSDFGYGNFGDVLQKLNALKIIKKSGQFSTVAVMSANAISHQDFPSWVVSAYSTDAVIFISEYPLILSPSDPDLQLVTSIKNLAGVYLYGGGFLNSMWGDYVLSVVEYFLKNNKQIAYWASGQQVTSPFENRVIEHIKNFKPRMFGVRDESSLQLLSEAGFYADYSFDDATEALVALSQKVVLHRGQGLLLHVNASDYTANKSVKHGLGRQLSNLSNCRAAKDGVTIFQAFRDSRQDVLDSTETIKQLDSLFPFHDTRLVDLVGLLLDQSSDLVKRPIEGAFGYSCSYHVTLWLQLAGIPCWLRSSNTFYDQKSRALQVTQGLEEFVREPKLADHRFNLERRQSWAEKFQDSLNTLAEVNNTITLSDDGKGPAPWPFFYKGKPTYQEKLNEQNINLRWQLERADAAEQSLTLALGQSSTLKSHAESLAAQMAHAGGELLSLQERSERVKLQLEDELDKNAELNTRLKAVTAQLTEVGHETHLQTERAGLAETRLETAKAQIGELNTRLQAVAAQLTEVSHETHLQTERAGLAETRLETAKAQTGELNARLHVLVTSRTHRATLKYYRLYEHGATRWFMQPLRRVAARIRRLIKG